LNIRRRETSRQLAFLLILLLVLYAVADGSLGSPPPAPAPPTAAPEEPMASDSPAGSEAPATSEAPAVGPSSAIEPEPSPPADVSASPTLREAIHDAIDDHERVPYSSRSAVDTWDVLSEADADLLQPGHVLTVYGIGSYPVASTANPDWEREHLWPRSYGLSDDDVCDYVYTDLHQLRPTEPDLNQIRGNKPFDACRGRVRAVKEVRDPTAGAGLENRVCESAWEVWPGRRGEIARSILYLDVRYEGGFHGVTGCPEPDLRLTDDPALIVPSDYPVDVAYMGMLSALLAWHLEDPPDDLERRRNDVVERYQGNRNPFVDHPEWVCAVWAGVGACGRSGSG